MLAWGIDPKILVLLSFNSAGDSPRFMHSNRVNWLLKFHITISLVAQGLLSIDS